MSITPIIYTQKNSTIETPLNNSSLFIDYVVIICLRFKGLIFLILKNFYSFLFGVKLFVYIHIRIYVCVLCIETHTHM